MVGDPSPAPPVVDAGFVDTEAAHVDAVSHRPGDLVCDRHRDLDVAPGCAGDVRGREPDPVAASKTDARPEKSKADREGFEVKQLVLLDKRLGGAYALMTPSPE